MTRNIYNGSFKESENFVTDDYIQKALLESEPKVVRKRFIGVIVILSFIIITYYFCIFLETEYPETGKLIPARFGNTWAILCMLIFIFYCIKMLHLKQIRVLSSYYYNLTILIAISIFVIQVYLFLLTVANIGLNSYLPVIVYPFISLIVIVNKNKAINKSILKALYENDIYENKFLKYYNKFDKFAKKFGGLTVVLLYVVRFFWRTETGTNNELSFISRVAATFSPLVFIIVFSLFMGMKEEVIQGFYLKKFCEKYRFKYGFSKEEWYGSKSKQFKEEKRGRRF